MDGMNEKPGVGKSAVRPFLYVFTILNHMHHVSFFPSVCNSFFRDFHFFTNFINLQNFFLFSQFLMIAYYFHDFPPFLLMPPSILSILHHVSLHLLWFLKMCHDTSIILISFHVSQVFFLVRLKMV